jgi:hypothetical protein
LHHEHHHRVDPRGARRGGAINVYLYVSEEYTDYHFDSYEPPDTGCDVAMIAAETRAKARYIGWKEMSRSYCDLSELRASVKRAGTIDHGPGILTDKEAEGYWVDVE